MRNWHIKNQSEIIEIRFKDLYNLGIFFHQNPMSFCVLHYLLITTFQLSHCNYKKIQGGPEKFHYNDRRLSH